MIHAETYTLVWGTGAYLEILFSEIQKEILLSAIIQNIVDRVCIVKIQHTAHVTGN
jgi:hypothetical protein